MNGRTLAELMNNFRDARNVKYTADEVEVEVLGMVEESGQLASMTADGSSGED